MIYSMTAFARGQREGNWGHLTCEMRSINHRYLEISLHLPEILRVFDMVVRERIRQKIKRGKIECAVRFQHPADAAGAMLEINDIYAKELCTAAESIGNLLRNPAPINPADILRFSGVLETREANLEYLEKELFTQIDQTIDELVAARAREGEELKQLFLQRMDAMQQEIAKVRKVLPDIMTAQREKLLKRFTDVKLDLDPTRLEQEMVMFAQKIDVTEELERTETHIGEVRRVLKQGGPIGRRMDFLLQELNREANTLGSKSTDTVVTHTAIEMKVLIEQVREQVQNIE
jgi:uncharacterized protein (TIGR00255 family)